MARIQSTPSSMRLDVDRAMEDKVVTEIEAYDLLNTYGIALTRDEYVDARLTALAMEGEFGTGQAMVTATREGQRMLQRMFWVPSPATSPSDD